MTGVKRAALVSEVGWRGMRELSLSLLGGDFLVDVIVKGAVDKKFLEVITTAEGLRIRAVPKVFFKMYLFLYLMGHKGIRDLKSVYVSKEQTRGFVRKAGFSAALLIETQKGYRLV